MQTQHEMLEWMVTYQMEATAEEVGSGLVVPTREAAAELNQLIESGMLVNRNRAGYGPILYGVTQRAMGARKVAEIRASLVRAGDAERIVLFDWMVHLVTGIYRTPKGKPLYLTAYQWRAVWALVQAYIYHTGHTIVLLFPRQTGKTTSGGVARSIVSAMIHVSYMAEDYPETVPVPLRRLVTQICADFPYGLRVVSYSPGAVQSIDGSGRTKQMLEFYVNQMAKQQPSNPLRWVRDGAEERILGQSLPNGGTQHYWSMQTRTSDPDSKKKDGPTADVLELEETQDIRESVWEENLTYVRDATGGPAVFFGTLHPYEVGLLDRMREEVEAKDPDHALVIDVDEVIASRYNNGDYEKGFLKTLAERGGNHPIVLTKYYHKRPKATAQLYTPHTWIRGLLPEDVAPEPWMRRPKSIQELADIARDLPPGVKLVGGLDVAEEHDKTVPGFGLVDWRTPISNASEYDADARRSSLTQMLPLLYDLFRLQWVGRDHKNQQSYLLRELEPLRDVLSLLAVDATGNRGGWVDVLAGAGWPVHPVEFSAGIAVGKGRLCSLFLDMLELDRFRVVVSESYCGSSDWQRVHGAKKEEIRLNRDSHFGDEVYLNHRNEALEAKVTVKNGRYNIEHKDAAKKSPGAYDDHVDESMLMMEAGLRVRGDMNAMRAFGQERVTSSISSQIKGAREQFGGGRGLDGSP